MVGIGVNEILKGSFIKQAKFCVNLAFLSAIYGYTAVMFVAIVSSFVYIFGKMVKNRLVLMLVLANALIMLFTYPDTVSILVEHGKHFQEPFDTSIKSQIQPSLFQNSNSSTPKSLKSQLSCLYFDLWALVLRIRLNPLTIILTFLTLWRGLEAIDPKVYDLSTLLQILRTDFFTWASYYLRHVQ